jgi:hypothetical protein
MCSSTGNVAEREREKEREREREMYSTVVYQLAVSSSSNDADMLPLLCFLIVSSK